MEGGAVVTLSLRRAVTGLLSFAAAEEQALLAAAGFAEPGEDPGGPDHWAAVPLVAHNNQFKDQQAERLRAVLAGQVPPAFGEIDHASAEVYAGYRAQPFAQVLRECRLVTAELIDRTWALPEEDLLDPGRHPWLNGRMLWLQIVVRGFWHPTGHVGDYYLGHGSPGRAVDMQAHAVATARYLGAPAPAVAMAEYSLACALARVGRSDEAAATLARAISANTDLRANASRDPDLAVLRSGGALDALLTPARAL
jgi:hypothetical protein